MGLTRKRFEIEEPTPELINKYAALFLQDESVSEKTVRLAFDNFGFDTVEEILTKVIILNNRYNAGLNDYPSEKENTAVDVVSMAEYLFNNRGSFLGIQNVDGVILWIENCSRYFEKKTKPVSFLSKFCAFSFPEINVPIYDRYARGYLYYLNSVFPFFGRPFSQNELLSYGFFCEVFSAFADKYGNGMNYKRLDEFIWCYAKKKGIMIG